MNWDMRVSLTTTWLKRPNEQAYIQTDYQRLVEQLAEAGADHSNIVDNTCKSLQPPESDIKETLAQMLQTNPTQIPVTLLQIQLERLMLQAIDKLKNDLETTVKMLENAIYDNT